MEFSVLMSVYINDKAEYIRQAIESISINQTLKPNQIVIVKDGPVDTHIENIISNCSRKCKDVKFTVITKSKNEGLAAALNDGLLACEYEWVARMDADDISLPDRFEKQIAFIEEHPSISVLGGAISEFETNELEIISTRSVQIEHNSIVNMARTRTPMNHVSVLYKKEDILSIGGYSENFGKLEDYKLWVDLIASGKVLHNISDILVNVRVGNGFIERRSNKREIVDWDMLQKYLVSAGIINKRKAIINRVYIRIFIYMPAKFKQIIYKTILRK